MINLHDLFDHILQRENKVKHIALYQVRRLEKLDSQLPPSSIPSNTWWCLLTRVTLAVNILKSSECSLIQSFSVQNLVFLRTSLTRLCYLSCIVLNSVNKHNLAVFCLSCTKIRKKRRWTHFSNSSYPIAMWKKPSTETQLNLLD